MKAAPMLLVAALLAQVSSAGVSVLGQGPDLLSATVGEIAAHRATFATSGLDGVALAVDVAGKDGKRRRGSLPMSGAALRADDFAAAIADLKAIAAAPGLKESLALVRFEPAVRLAWTDEAAWARVVANLKVLGETVAAGGLKGFVVTHRDKNGQWTVTGADDRRLARARGKAAFAALVGTFDPHKVKIEFIEDPADDPATDLWPDFLKGAFEVIGPRLAFDHENHIVAGCLTDTFRSGFPVDAYADGTEALYALSSDPKARLAEFSRDVSRSVDARLEHFWLCAARGTWIDWGRAAKGAFARPTLESQLPGFGRVLRGAVGDFSFCREAIRAGTMKNLLDNSGCDGSAEGVPRPYDTWTPLKKPPRRLFGFDAETGLSRAGSLKLTGEGCFVVQMPVTAGRGVYVRIPSSGILPTINLSWRLNGHPCAIDPGRRPNEWMVSSAGKSEWRQSESYCIVPAGVNRLFLTFGCAKNHSYVPATRKTPVWFDDIGVYMEEGAK